MIRSDLLKRYVQAFTVCIFHNPILTLKAAAFEPIDKNKIPSEGTIVNHANMSLNSTGKKNIMNCWQF